jgi:hypothetical protein
MKEYAHIQDGLVVDTFETEGDITEMFHPSWLWVEITGVDVKPKSGWKAEESVDGWSFTLPEPNLLSPEQLEFLAITERDSRLSKADSVTSGMGDAFITGILSDKDTTTFKKYAAYKLALNKINLQEGYPLNIDWPVEPTL